MAAPYLQPFRLAPFFSPRVWGTIDLSPWYGIAPTEPIGEAWLTGSECVVETGPLQGKTLAEVGAKFSEELTGSAEPSHQQNQGDYPLLLKILFPHDKLSVQVHPDDRLANEIGQPRGKTECWYVLQATPEAYVSLGLKDGVSLDTVRSAVADQTLEELLVQVPVKVGDMIFVDAGTVHAIGPGLILLETQQSSDITYRLYDYGRPRELHVDRALQATRLATAAGQVRSEQRGLGERLIEQQYFIVDRMPLDPQGSFRSLRPTGVPHALVSVEGTATLHAPGCEPVQLMKGQAVVVPACVNQYEVQADEPCVAIRSMPPALL